MDDNIEPWLFLLAIFALAVLNAYVLTLQYALTKCRATRLKDLAGDDRVYARRVAPILDDLPHALSALQFIATLTGLGMGWLAADVTVRFVTPGLATSPWSSVGAFGLFLVLTLAHFLLAGIVPRRIAGLYPDAVVLRHGLCIRAFAWVVRPVALFGEWVGQTAIRASHASDGAAETAHSEEELRLVISASGTDNGGALHETQAELIDNVLEFGHRLARQIMVHRMDVVTLEIEEALAENARVAQQHGYTRYPVIDGDIDTVVGFVHAKDLFALCQRDPHGEIREIIREALVVPETIRTNLLLRQMQQTRRHLAVLVDEYGGTAGVVTLSDLLEELVGALPDEFEVGENEEITALGPRRWSVDGLTTLADFAEVYGEEIPCSEPCDTVGGFVYWAFGSIPREGDTVQKNGFTLRVTAMEGRRISRVEITAEEQAPVAGS